MLGINKQWFINKQWCGFITTRVDLNNLIFYLRNQFETVLNEETKVH